MSRRPWMALDCVRTFRTGTLRDLVSTVIRWVMGADADNDVPAARAASADVGDGGEAAGADTGYFRSLDPSDEVEVSRGRRG